MLYGVSPFSDRSAEALDLEPVMTLAARVVAVRGISEGEAVGYGGTWRARRNTRIATLPLGYADGLPRSLSAGGEVFLAGGMRAIVGRVSMDFVTLDVGDTAVRGAYAKRGVDIYDPYATATSGTSTTSGGSSSGLLIGLAVAAVVVGGLAFVALR